MTKLVLADEYIEKMRHYTDAENDDKMQTARLISEYWEETGDAIASVKNISKRSAHKLFIESTAGHLSNVNPSSLYNRSRVGRNIIMRGLDKAHDVVTFSAWLCLLRNAPKEKGLVPLVELEERLEWYYNEMDRFGGQPPSTRDINKHFKKNGDKPEDQVYWKRIVSNAKRMSDLNKYSDARQMMIVVEIIRLQKEIEEEVC